MDYLLTLARGPLFAACFLLMLLGLLRLIFLKRWEYRESYRSADGEAFPARKVLRSIGSWLVPPAHLRRADLISQVAGPLSFLFHMGVIVVPLFLAGHIVLWKRALGLSWWALPYRAADILTVMTIAAALGLLAIRLFHKATRSSSQPADYFLLLLLVLPFAAGFLAAHPALSPFSYKAILLVHVISADLMMALMPFSKLSHAVLFPAKRMSSEIYWHFPLGAGDQIALELHGRKEPFAL